MEKAETKTNPFEPDPEFIISEAASIVADQLKADDLSLLNAHHYSEKSRWSIEFYEKLRDSLGKQLGHGGEEASQGKLLELQKLVLTGSPAVMVSAKRESEDPFDRYALTMLSKARYNKRGSKVIMRRTDFQINPSVKQDSDYLPLPDYPAIRIPIAIASRRVSVAADTVLQLDQAIEVDNIEGRLPTSAKYALGTAAAIGAGALVAVGTKLVSAPLRKK